MTDTERYHRDEAADANREAKIEADRERRVLPPDQRDRPDGSEYTQEQVFAELPTVTAANFTAGKPRESSHDFTEFGLEATYHKRSNTIEHKPDGYAHGDDCVYRIVETWHADEFEKATLYVLGYDRWSDVMQSDNLEAIYLVLVNIWTFDKRFSKRHYKQHPEAAEQAEYENSIPY